MTTQQTSNSISDERNFRPQTLEEFIGQSDLKKNAAADARLRPPAIHHPGARRVLRRPRSRQDTLAAIITVKRMLSNTRNG
jgi:Holliday junction resolvasome RuvABC ATP-dependent DNA helicase subunit